MRIGLALPHYDFSFPDGGPVSYERLRDAAVRAEALGFDSGWVSDHFLLSLARYGGGDEPQGSLEPMTALAALATATSTMRLGTLVLGPFRHPGQLAREARDATDARDRHGARLVGNPDRAPRSVAVWPGSRAAVRRRSEQRCSSSASDDDVGGIRARSARRGASQHEQYAEDCGPGRCRPSCRR